MKRTIQNLIAGFAVIALTSSAVVPETFNYSNSTPPKDLVFMSHSHKPGERQIIAVKAKDIAEHIKHGDWIVPFDEDLKGWIGHDDID